MVFQNLIGLKTERQHRFQILDPRHTYLRILCSKLQVVFTTQIAIRQ